MKFNTKQDFIEAVREFTIQEGRQIKWRRNESYRARAICMWKKRGCKWVDYASKDREETCWQMKTFYNDHICPRKSKNRAANRKWLAGKLVKKLRKYPNLKHGEAATYFKRRCDLDLNKSSLNRALTDARNVHSRLQKIRKESGKWLPIWSGDEHYERFEIHGWPTNMAVDLGKSICTCRFWQITGMPCVHACAALSQVNKDPEDFCHKWLTMDSYKATYLHSLNPIPGEALWEKSQYLKPLAPKVAPLVPIQPTRPNKLPPKRRSQHSTAANMDPMQGASSGTAARLAGVMRFVPTPGFIPPRKK
ncbi:hypothetical protein Ahy_B01g056676 [Arachis hypogaea]|uniref:SWIM-type domain-containing protein n=1 Tax=Arachis hypogaea TaxID=3818 RepID=A0A445AZC3_ARAHY|nr:hypothetical protein Ahy_B01g056676 [Arachis hypogaea]